MEESVSMSIINSTSKFRLLSSSNASKTELVQRYYGKIGDILDLMRTVLDETFPQIIPDDKLIKMLEEIDAAINEASELVGGWNQMMSKIYFVTQAESIITKMQTYVLELCQAVNSLMLQSESSSVSMYLEKLDHTYCEKISVVIREASRDIAGEVMPTSETLAKIQATLSLFTNQELLMEAVALAKIKMKGNIEGSAQLAGINDIVDLVNRVLDKHVEEKQMHSINGVPIPADFCCPLSLELMSDPVIVASGQTYEHVFIKKWLDMGYNVCPKTRQTLGHTKLIPNYTVKQLIENWCEIHGIVLPDPVKPLSLSFPASLNLTDGNPSDKYPSTDSSPSANKSESPEHSELSALHAKVQRLSDNCYHGDLMHENSDSDDRISSFEDR